MKHTVFAASFVLAAMPALAQDRNELAQSYVNLPEVQAMIDDMFSPNAMAVQFRSNLPAGVTFPDENIQRVAIVLSDAMNTLRPRMTELMIASTSRNLSAEEIEALIAFYSSEHGAAIMSKMPLIMEEVMTGLAPELRATNANLGAEIQSILIE